MFWSGNKIILTLSQNAVFSITHTHTHDVHVKSKIRMTLLAESEELTQESTKGTNLMYERKGGIIIRIQLELSSLQTMLRVQSL